MVDFDIIHPVFPCIIGTRLMQYCPLYGFPFSLFNRMELLQDYPNSNTFISTEIVEMF